MAGKCYNKLGDMFMQASLSKQTNRIKNLKIFARHVYASFPLILCQYLKFFIRIGNQRVSQSKICFSKVLVNHSMVPIY